jgi:hypothetical protein
MWEPFLEMAVEYLRRQQDRLKSEFQLGRWPRYDYDQESGTLTFSSDGRVEVLADIHIVGSTSKRSGTWLWAWDNPSILENVKHCLADVRAYGENHGLEKLTTAKWAGDERDGWEMTAAVAFILRAEGGYRAPHDNGALFMVLRNVRRPGQTDRLTSHLSGPA